MKKKIFKILSIELNVISTVVSRKKKTVSGKVSRGGSHDTNRRRPYIYRLALDAKNVNSYIQKTCLESF